MATFETRPRRPEDIAHWLDEDGPFLVAEDEAGRVVGWTRAGPYSSRPAYRTVGEHAVYVHPDARGHGLGSLLLEALCQACAQQGMHKLTSRVFAENAASRAAHRAAGFFEVGIQPRHGMLDGEWKDCVLVERLLGDVSRVRGSGA